MLTPFLLLASLPIGALAGDILKTDGFSSCQSDAEIQVKRLDMEFNRATKKIDFDISAYSAKVQNVTASMIVTAYGKQVYQKDFNPCDKDNYVQQLCPVPEGDFSAKGEQQIPDNFISQIPSIAFSVPDLDGQATLQLKSLETGKELACIQSSVNNGKSFNVPAVSYVAAGIAGAALILSGVSALGAGHGGAATSSPTFGEVIGWFQSMALNGMMSVSYPGIYKSFTKNFAFSGGLIYWEGMQTSIDNFRKSTGGNLTEDSVAYLKNVTLVSPSSNKNLTTRGLESFVLFARDSLNTQVNGTNANSTSDSKLMHTVSGIQAYVEELTIPQANTFMTVLLVFAIVIAAITVGILLFKVILETWALFGTFPKSLTSFRKRYWWLLAKTITNLILLLYGVWVLYCVYQFTNGDSWAAKLLAGVTLAMFTAILAFFTWKIWHTASKFKKMEGDAAALYDDKEIWRKYSLFYENYKKAYWWIFVPSIVYMFAKGCVIAGADGHGLVQSAGQLIVESLLFIVLLWSRPYSLKSGNWINITIQVVRVLSVVCILVFVEELGVAQTTKTITGLVLVVMQSVLTALLAILIAVNAIIACCRDNPHRRKRKEAEKLNRDLDTLTPLDARNSLLMDPTGYKSTDVRGPMVSANPLGPYEQVPLNEQTTGYSGRRAFGQTEDQNPLLTDSASFGGRSTSHGRSISHSRSESRGRSVSPPSGRAPRLPDIDLGAPGTYGGRPAY
ncbi:DUF907 domain protein [Mytilinidion resinicola]|uniref:DUF907 domain protein n=1 Tax=Mytilinidion resinicola TaxID=574789 RepID=A0A6A6YII5_9PEZI|nr:DUF907 domain protein [Mytilinidion resinicola]KAF2807737.1 DUF907 domain protein [Mytilinidion resinicola]